MEVRTITITPEPKRTEKEIQTAYQEILFKQPEQMDMFIAEGFCGLCGSLCFKRESIGQQCASCFGGTYLSID